MPASSYVMPTQQLVCATYFFLAALSLESIAVFYLARWKIRSKRAQVWTEGGLPMKREPRSNRTRAPWFNLCPPARLYRTGGMHTAMQRRSVPRSSGRGESEQKKPSGPRRSLITSSKQRQTVWPLARPCPLPSEVTGASAAVAAAPLPCRWTGGWWPAKRAMASGRQSTVALPRLRWRSR